jgi:chromosome segregation ATPase
MARLKTYEEFVNENIGAALGSPIKYTKIKNNAKKYQKHLVKQALNDVDYKKKLQTSKGNLDAKQKETLKAANDAKNSALKDTTAAVSQRMDDLATTDGLKKVVTLAKTKSRIAANKTILKAATGEEAKQLKIKVKELEGKAAKAKTALSDYESTDKSDEPSAADADLARQDKIEQEKKKNKNNQETTSNDNTSNDTTSDEGGNDAEDPKIAGLENDIKAYNNSIEQERATMTKAMKELEKAQRDLKLGRTSEEEVQKIQKAIEDSKEDIAELKGKEKKAKTSLDKLTAKNESFEYVAESVSQKFARLRANMNEGIEGYWNGDLEDSEEKILDELGYDFGKASAEYYNWMDDKDFDKHNELIDDADDKKGLAALTKFLMKYLPKLKKYGIKDKKAIENFAKFYSSSMWPKS